MTATVWEIAQNSGKARVITETAVTKANSASKKVNELGQAALDIRKVTEAITESADQTNLLALNATIEVVRAGEAGKGFAVVANATKELARQIATATQQIKSRIEGIQNSTNETVVENGQISKVNDEVNDIVSTIATAVEEQSFSS
jgi:methyl-accepting chemotaxis protein